MDNHKCINFLLSQYLIRKETFETNPATTNSINNWIVTLLETDRTYIQPIYPVRRHYISLRFFNKTHSLKGAFVCLPIMPPPYQPTPSQFPYWLESRSEGLQGACGWGKLQVKWKLQDVMLCFAWEWTTSSIYLPVGATIMSIVICHEGF